ncbi:MAG: carbohydrate-binding family 9-like protein [Pyrinomonadaceae bacterium]|jgi:alpha-galactosidase|nr:carbohydrate-binding family 9-like protein [Pyrinomonadaceae bacterium]MBA3571777.1 carbohydrate-binding family 9-like protein [Pyrinomonadaceae bacterium]
MSSTATIETLYTATDLSAAELDHADWDRVKATPLTRYWSGNPAPADRHAEARILWSDGSLYIRFVCRQTEPLIISSNPQTETKTMGLWDRDVCEAFLAPNPEQPNRYLEFEVAPTGEWIDLAVNVKPGQRETEWDFDSGMTTTARIGKGQIIIAMRIPWGERIHKPQRGERWRVNLFRCVGGSKDRGYLAWQPTHTEQPNFHVPEAFGWLVFDE